MVAAKKHATNGSRAKQIPLKSIRLDGDTQSRDKLSEDVIKEYAGLLADGVEFPPLLVVHDGSHYWLVDGFHRRFAAVKAKLDKFKCVVVTGTREDARWLSYGANIDHGLPRRNEDKVKAVTAALKHPKGLKLSDNKIAEHVGVSHTMVGKYRPQVATSNGCKSDERTGRDGRTIKVTKIGKKKSETKSNGAVAAKKLPSQSDSPPTPAEDETETETPVKQMPPAQERSVFTDLRKLFDLMTETERIQAAEMWSTWMEAT